MIGIRIDDEFLDVPPDVKIQVSLNNPILNEDTNLSKGSFSLPFDVPGEENSPKNSAILGNPDVLENMEGFRKVDAQLLVDGNLFKKGKLIVREAQEGKISTNFNFGLSTISEEFKTKKVREIISQTITIDSANHPKKVYLKAGALAANPYSITVNGRVYEAATVSALATAINADVTEPRASATYVTSGTTPLGVAQPFIEISAYTNPNDPLSPLHVDYDGDNGNSSTGFVWYIEPMDLTAYNTAFSDFMDDYNTDPYPSDAIRFPALFNDSFTGQGLLLSYYGGYTDGGVKATNYVNMRWQFGFLTNSADYGAGINVPFKVLNRNSIQPFLRMKWVLDKIAEYFNFEWEGNWFDSDVTNMLIDNAAALDAPLDYIGKTKFVFWRRSFDLAELIEDVTVVDLLKALQSRYNLGVYFNERTGRVRVMKRESTALQVVDEDITPQAGRIKSRTDLRLAGVRLVTPKDETDEYSAADEYTVGDPELTVETKLGALQQEFTGTIGGGAGDVTGPYKRQNFSEKFKLRVFYYKGLYDNGTFIYPKAGINALNYNEAWSGANGLYAERWQYWIYFAMRRRAITLPVAFYFQDLRNFDFELLKRFDRKQFLVKSINADITNSGVMVSEVELWTMF